MMLVLAGSIAIDPTASEGWESVSAVQVGLAEVALVDFQTPPWAPPT
jgi:hypothetical protein